MEVSLFVPLSLWRVRSGWLLGWWKEHPKPIVYILAVLHSSEPASQALADRSVIPEGRVGFMPCVLGELRNNCDDELTAGSSASRLLKEVANIYVKLKVFGCDLSVEEIVINQSIINIESHCMVYTYDPAPILSSELLSIKSQKHFSTAVFVQEKFDQYSCVEKLLAVLRQWRQYYLKDIYEITDTIIQTTKRNSHYHPENTVNACNRPKGVTGRLQKMAFSSAFVRQVHQRTSHVWYLSYSVGHNGSCLRCRNTLTSLFTDVFIGLFFLWCFHHVLVSGHVFNLFMSSATAVVGNLQRLICWLMGVPAGFKLNQPLNSALGHFFLYHIYLWETYINVVKPVLQYIMETITLLGCFGVSFQLSVLSDLISLATFHIYCFYVYAARLYHLHLCGLMSLWRLVRGRKWNPLRQRVDSCAYGKDQLLLGALLFMILLFLLPTTLMYYVVFSALRLSVLLTNRILNRLTTVISTYPIWSTILWVIKADMVSGEIQFRVNQGCKNGQPTTLVLKAIPTSFSKVYEATVPINYTERDKTTYNQLLKDLIVGNLIYPL